MRSMIEVIDFSSRIADKHKNWWIEAGEIDEGIR